MSPHAVTQHGKHWALFLDVDGAWLEVAETPQRIQISEKIKQLLVTLSVRLDGAVALVSGRSLDDVDRLFAPLRFCVAGMWGCEYRESSGCVTRAPLRMEELAAARQKLQAVVRQHTDLYLENRRYGLAVHFRRVPHLEEEVRLMVSAACSDLGPQFVVEAGRCYVEVRPSVCTIASTISFFMQQAPFARRVPIFIGGDPRDEWGFDVVNDLGGVSIRVGAAEHTVAKFGLSGVDDVIQWLASVAINSDDADGHHRSAGYPA